MFLYPASLFDDILFFDLETATGHADFSELSPILQDHWVRRARNGQEWRFVDGQTEEDHDPAVLYAERAAIYPEFGRVVCASFGYYHPGEKVFKLTSVCSADEKAVLQQSFQILARHVREEATRERTATGWEDVAKIRAKPLCGHNIKQFDLPYLVRRGLIHGLELPTALQIRGQKPWDLAYLLDTYEDWRLTGRLSAPLELLTELLGLPSPKQALGGQYVTDAFWRENALERIAHYCEQDVLATAQIVRRLSGLAPLADNQVRFSSLS